MRAVIVLLLLGVGLPCPAAPLEAFRFSKKVQWDPPQAECILSVALDSDIFTATRPGFPDLRVVDGKGQEVPYVLEKATEKRVCTRRIKFPTQVVSLQEKDGGIEVVVRIGKKKPPADGLILHTPLEDFERRATVFGSTDGQSWEELVDNALVFDYSRYMDVRNQAIPLPKNNYRQLKIVISDITESRESPWMEMTRKYQGQQEKERIERTMLQRRPLRIDRIEAWEAVEKEYSKQDQKRDYPVAEFSCEKDPKQKSTIVHVRTRREPLTKFTLETPSRNFSRQVVVQKPVTHGIRTDWVDIGRGKISLLDFRGFHKEKLNVKMPEHRQNEYRLVIRNLDSPPLEITGVQTQGNVYHVVFLAADDKKYQVIYGADEVKSPTYDAATVLLSLRKGNQILQGSLGEEEANSGAETLNMITVRRLLNNAYVLGIVICVMVVCLGWALYCAVHRINQLPSD